MYTKKYVRGEKNSEKVNAFLTTIFPRDFSSSILFSIESRLKRERSRKRK